MTRHNDVPAGGDSEEPEATTALEGAALNLMFVRAALRRKRWLWMGTALLGLVLAAGMNLHRPVKFSAVSRINMALSSTTAPDIAIADDVSLLKTNAVAARAVADGHLNIAPELCSPTTRARRLATPYSRSPQLHLLTNWRLNMQTLSQMPSCRSRRFRAPRSGFRFNTTRTPSTRSTKPSKSLVIR